MTERMRRVVPTYGGKGTSDLVSSSRFHIAMSRSMKAGLLQLAAERSTSAAAVARTAIQEYLASEGIEAIGTGGPRCKHPRAARQNVGAKQLCGLCLDTVD